MSLGSILGGAQSVGIFAVISLHLFLLRWVPDLKLKSRVEVGSRLETSGVEIATLKTEFECLLCIPATV